MAAEHHPLAINQILPQALIPADQDIPQNESLTRSFPPIKLIDCFAFSIDQSAAPIDKEKLEKAEFSEESKTKWKSIPASIQQMITRVSSTRDDIFI